ncbi:MAG: Flp pilus assembly protein CpaB [Firmicutes bacterium]|nr:Flp pilus assembly protein CpaB [Bacillota bacterium]
MAVTLTLVIYRGANVKYSEYRKTVDVVKVAQFIPAGYEIRPDQVTTVKLPEAVSKDFVADVNQVVSKAAKVSLVEGQYITPGVIGDVPRKSDMVEVDVPVDLSSSAAVFAGDIVDILAVDKNQQAAQAFVIYRGAKVLHSYDSNGAEVSPVEKKAQAVGPPGGKVPASVGLEVPKEVAPAVVQAASQKRIYLVKVSPAG